MMGLSRPLTSLQRLKLTGEPEDLVLRIVQKDLRVLHRTAVSFSISPAVGL